MFGTNEPLNLLSVVKVWGESLKLSDSEAPGYHGYATANIILAFRNGPIFKYV